jgi:hypothetical protein
LWHGQSCWRDWSRCCTQIHHLEVIDDMSQTYL